MLAIPRNERDNLHMELQVIFSLFLGSILTFLATTVTGVLIEKYKNRRRKTSFKIRVKLELSQAIKSLDEIRNAQSRQKWYDYQLLNILDSSVDNLQQIRKDVSLLGDESVQQRAYDAIIKIARLAQNMRALQDYEYDNTDTSDTKTKFIEESKVKNDIDLTDLKRDIEELKKAIVS